MKSIEEHWTAETVKKYLKLKAEVDVLSLNYRIVKADDGDDPLEFGELLQYDGPSPEDIAIEKERSNNIIKLMEETLSPREYKVVSMRYGFQTGSVMTLTEIAKQFHITRERVRQIETKALRKLRHCENFRLKMEEN